MFHILTLNQISPVGLEVLNRHQTRHGGDVQEPDGILVRSASMHGMELPAQLKAIARAGAGVNNIPVDLCSEKGVVVFNTPGANANAVKELAMLGLLLSARKVYPAMEWVQSLKGKKDEVPALVEKGKGSFGGPELFGKSLGVIGLGAIGIAVANFARHFGMEVYGYDPYLSVDAAWGLSRSIRHAHTLREVYENCDFISIHVPLMDATRGMINTESIGQMRQGVRILNFARGELVNNQDMLTALEAEKVCCYITDFPSDELLGRPGVVAIPHLGASTPESEENCALMAAQELMDYLKNGNIKNSVNLPDVVIPRNGGARIGIIHRNIPAMISSLSQLISDKGLNIENLTNKGKGDYAYTLVDIAGEVSDKLMEELAAVKGIIRVNRF